MSREQNTRRNSLIAGAVAAAVGVIGLWATGYYAPLPDRAPDTGGVFVYYGPEGETVPAQGTSPETRVAAEAALENLDYFGAYAEGPGGRIGAWTGAMTPELARSYALAACGAECRVVAERLPLHRDPDRGEPVATAAMAQNLGVHWPYIDDHIALGGAGAWGHRPEPAGKGTWKRAMRDAAADCEARRAAEAAPDPSLSPPCRVQRLREIEDLRPKPQLYPAAFTIAPAELRPVTETRVVRQPGVQRPWIFGPYLPPRLYGARAANGDGSSEVVRQAGWPAAGKAIALAKCNASRRPGTPDCTITHVREPKDSLSEDTIAVTPELYESYLSWKETTGPGAFAVSPYGVWGYAYNHPDVESAIQKAADWCWYYTRRTWEYRQVYNAFLDAGVACRIVAVRGRDAS